jgi:hypothetical protein
MKHFNKKSIIVLCVFSTVHIGLHAIHGGAGLDGVGMVRSWTVGAPTFNGGGMRHGPIGSRRSNYKGPYNANVSTQTKEKSKKIKIKSENVRVGNKKIQKTSVKESKNDVLAS